LRASAPANGRGAVVRGVQVGGERLAPFVYLLSPCCPARHGAGGLGSGELAGGDLRPLPGVGYARRRRSMVQGESLKSGILKEFPAACGVYTNLTLSPLTRCLPSSSLFLSI